MEAAQRSNEASQASFFRRNGPFLLFLLGMACIGFLAQFQWVGYIIILVYVILSFAKKQSVRTTFLLALLTLGVVPVAILLSNWLVAQNFAAYSFVLLVFGVVMTIIEFKRTSRVK